MVGIGEISVWSEKVGCDCTKPIFSGNSSSGVNDCGNIICTPPYTNPLLNCKCLENLAEVIYTNMLYSLSQMKYN